ncbi:MAG: hypothetical protein WC919_05900, partial [Candidatus Paceibacterota bacterium]
ESISSLCKKQRLVLQIKERKQKNESKITQQHNNTTTQQQNKKTIFIFCLLSFFRSFPFDMRKDVTHARTYLGAFIITAPA